LIKNKNNNYKYHFSYFPIRGIIVKKELIYTGGFALIIVILLIVILSMFFLNYTGNENGNSNFIATAIQPESCMTCHNNAGDEHQESYDELYQDGVIEISNLDYSFNSGNHIVSFTTTKEGMPINAGDLDSLGIYFISYTGSSFEAERRQSLKGSLSYDGKGGLTSTISASETIYTNSLDNIDGLIVIYGRDDDVGRLPVRIRQTKYPFAAILETGGGVNYVSPANNAGCEKCHTIPYLKHGYIYGQVNHDPSTDFYTCKACHLDNGEGGHFIWQLLVDDPELIIELEEQYGEDWEESGDEQLTPYAYKTTLMNDVHMSHSMEFPYPQSISNCVTCHQDKLDMILTDDNFKVETCKSCHPVTGSEEYETSEFALETTMTSPIHDDMDLETTDCISCHGAGGFAPTFSEIHTGYDKIIYSSDGIKYSEAIEVTIDSASFANNQLTIEFSATELKNIDNADINDIEPTIMIGLYGYDSKDYIIGPHERLFDDNNDGEISRASGDLRALESVVGEEHPRIKTVLNSNGKWEVIADLSAWSDLITNGAVKRVEIGVMPSLVNTDDVEVALIAPSRTFDIIVNDFDDDFYSPIVKVENGCNNCHEALATTFHSPDRGGNIIICRMCHITKSGGSHLEMQSNLT
jgi:mono/diheme cytochrome c family protein